MRGEWSEARNDQESQELRDIRAFEERAGQRPCTKVGLLTLERDFENYVVMIRNKREVRRAESPIDPESEVFRRALHSVRVAIRRAQAEHVKASCQIDRARELVRLGHVHQASILRTQSVGLGKYADLNLDFVEDAVLRQRRRELRLFLGFLTVSGIVLGVVCIVEALLRSVRK